MNKRIEKLKSKYEKYISNLEWHVRVNNPDIETLKMINDKLECYREIVFDLSDCLMKVKHV